MLTAQGYGYVLFVCKKGQMRSDHWQYFNANLNGCT